MVTVIEENLPLDRVPKLRDFYANYGYSTHILEEASKLILHGKGD